MNWALVYGIDDISREEATTYLMDKGVTQAEAKKVVECAGGRLVDL